MRLNVKRQMSYGVGVTHWKSFKDLSRVKHFRRFEPSFKSSSSFLLSRFIVIIIPFTDWLIKVLMGFGKHALGVLHEYGIVVCC